MALSRRIKKFEQIKWRSPGAGFFSDSPQRLVIPVFILKFLVSETTYDMIVYHADCLHKGVTNCCPNELEPSSLQIFAHGFRLRSADINGSMLAKI